MERLIEKPPCERCRKLKGERWSEKDCRECLPECWPENRDAVNVYSKVLNQYIIGPRGVIALKHEPIHMAMELYQVEDKQSCFEKVLTLADHFIGKQG